MGGKNKQSQRTKNNARPSSSGRSAELLNNQRPDGGNVKALPALFPSLMATALNSTLLPEFTLCFKKLNKKDPITRTKALQELTELVSNSKQDAVVAALPSWAVAYRSRAADPDRKAREHAQICHGAFVAACGRRLAPQLRALLPVWLQSQHDEHAPAMAIARRTLASTFPAAKLPEVVAFCKAEVAAHLLQVLLAPPAHKVESAEERELLQISATRGALQTLRALAASLPPAHAPWLAATLQPLLASSAFWQMRAHPEPHLRATWYAAVGQVWAFAGASLDASCSRKALRLALGCREPAAPAAPHYWTALLHVMHSSPDWYEWLDKKELLVKRILDLLENGGWGEARSLSLTLLPLLARLPPALRTPAFYRDFFQAYLAGLETKNVISSKSERQWWITSLAECLRYLSIQSEEFVVEVVTAVHRSWLEAATTRREPQIGANLVRHSATSMTSLVKYWLKLSKTENGQKYDQLMRNFWQNVGSTLTTQIDQASTEPDDVASLIERHILLLHTLKVSFLQEVKKQHSIKFEDDEKVEECATTEPADQPCDTCDAAATGLYEHNLNDVVRTICGGYFEFASRKQMAGTVFGALATLLVQFESKELLAAIARQLGADSVYNLYDSVLKGWLCGDTMRCKPLVDVVFLLVRHVVETEQDAVLESFKLFPPSVVEWCLAVGLSHPHRAVPAVQRWLRGRLVQQTVLGVCRRALDDGDDAMKNLLLMCLSQDDHGELTVSESCLWRVVELVSSAGEGAAEGMMPACVTSLAAALAAALPARTPPRVHLQLAGSMFRLNLCVHRGDPILPVDSWLEARGCWQEAAPPLARQLVAHAGPLIQQRLQHQSNTLNITEMEHITSLCPYLLSQCERGQPADLAELVELTQLLFEFPPEDTGTVNVEVFALRHDCMTSHLNCLFDEDNKHIKKVIDDSASVEAADITEESLLNFLNKLLFKAIYLRTMLLHKPEEEGEDKAVKARCWCDTLFKDKFFVEEFTRVLYDYCVLCSLHDGYAYWPHYNYIQQAKQKLDILLDDVIAETSAEARATIMASLSEMAATVGYYWAFARRWLEVKAQEEAAEKDEGEGETNLEDIVTGNGFFHSMQANTKNSSDHGVILRTSYLTMLRSLYAACSQQSDVIDEQFVRDAVTTQQQCGAAVLLNLHYRHQHTLTCDRDITDAPWPQVVATAASARYLADLVSVRGWDEPPHHWDFITITLCALLDSLDKSKEAWGTTKVALLAHSVFKLYRAVVGFVSSVREQCERREPAPHVAQLPREWNDVFEPHTIRCLANCTLRVLESTSTAITAAHICYISALSAAVSDLRWPHIAASGVPSLERVTRAACDVMRAGAHHSLMYCAHAVLLAAAGPLVLEDAEKLAAWEALAAAEDDEESAERQKPQLALAYFQDAIAELETAVDTMLLPFRIGEDTCSLEPRSAAHGTALGYLLLSDALHCALYPRQRQDRALHYIELLRGNRMAELLLTSSLRLLPPPLAAIVAETSSAPVPQHYLDMFTSVKKFDVYEPPQSSDIGALACRGAYGACAGAGRAAARAWWGAAAPRAARAAVCLVRLCVAPPLVRAHLRDLHARAPRQLQHAQISIVWSSREATCSYRVEDKPLDVTVTFSDAHPLQPPRVACPHRAAPAHAQHWLQLYLAYQNGSLVKAFQMWMRAVSAKMERAPQCYICYCRLHPSTGHLPAAPCRQCGNKFHTQCLRKWFSTSKKSSCPLCRGTF